jgi:hypothetical protein
MGCIRTITTLMLASAVLAFAANARAQPPGASCLSADDRKMMAQTSRLLVNPAKLSHIISDAIVEEPGLRRPRCTVVAITVSADGSVKAAWMLHDEAGYGKVLTAAAMKQRFARRARTWQGRLGLVVMPPK